MFIRESRFEGVENPSGTGQGWGKREAPLEPLLQAGGGFSPAGPALPVLPVGLHPASPTRQLSLSSGGVATACEWRGLAFLSGSPGRHTAPPKMALSFLLRDEEPNRRGVELPAQDHMAR